MVRRVQRIQRKAVLTFYLSPKMPLRIEFLFQQKAYEKLDPVIQSITRPILQADRPFSFLPVTVSR